MKQTLYLLLILSTTIASGCAATTPITPASKGDTIDLSALQNQHGKPFKNPSAMQLLLYVGGMEAKEIVRESFEKINLQCLTTGQVVYVADISGMPSIISKLVAVPRMRDYPYPIWLDYEGDTADMLPAKEDTVTVINIAEQRIAEIQFVAEADSLAQTLLGLCGENATEGE